MEIERRNTWIGILIGACCIAAGPFIGYFLLDVFSYIIIFSLIGGFISGIFTSGNLKDGIRSGFWSGLIGSLFIAVPFVWLLVSTLLSGTAGFVEGLAIPLGLLFGIGVTILASIAAGIGIMVKRAFLGSSTFAQQ